MNPDKLASGSIPASPEPEQVRQPTEGWGKLANAKLWHYFQPNGRSLCGKWLSLVDPIWDMSDLPVEKCSSDSCKGCHAKLMKRSPISPSTSVSTEAQPEANKS